MLRGPATLTFYATDLAAAKDWYTELLGIEPYFMNSGPDGRPAYYEFRIGDFETELGLIDARFAPPGQTSGPAGSVLNWAVDDLEASLERLISMGAKEYQPITAHGDKGFVTASVVDPFGNILGIMSNPHYMEIVRTLKGEPQGT
jgi:predicted enzyme related to lactoylglutathione lyase